MRLECWERIGVDGQELKHMQVDTQKVQYDYFEKMGEGKYKSKSSLFGSYLFSECLPLEGRWTVMFINHNDTDEKRNEFGIQVRDSNGKVHLIDYRVKSRQVLNP